MADFAYTPSEINESSDFGVTKVQMGDGYVQRIPNGINNALRVWEVEFADVSQATADAIVNFFRTRNGSTSFTWRPQGYAADVRVVCGHYTRPIQNRFIGGTFVYTVRATFDETPL